VSEDLIDRLRADDDNHPVDVSEIMRLAELYPAIPLQSVIREVLHAQQAVAHDAEKRAEIVAQMVTTRLASHADG
jgi:hypothetical protein